MTRQPSQSDIDRNVLAENVAVAGVVIAGVVASFVLPGPFDWGTTMLGVMLGLILIGFGAPPRMLTFRPALGTASAAAFCLILVFGRPFDMLGDLFGKEFVFSGWETKWKRPEQYEPSPDGGLLIALVWASFVVMLMVGWRVCRNRGDSTRSFAVRGRPGANPR